MMRSAISPRLAMRIFLNIRLRVVLMANRRSPYCTALPFSTYDVDDFALVLGRDLVHQLHRFDDAEHLVLLHVVADLDERGGAWLRGAVERADDRRLDDREIDRLILCACSRRAGFGRRAASGGGESAAPRRQRAARPAASGTPPRPSGRESSGLRVRARTPPDRAGERAPECALCPRTPSPSRCLPANSFRHPGAAVGAKGPGSGSRAATPRAHTQWAANCLSAHPSELHTRRRRQECRLRS